MSVHSYLMEEFTQNHSILCKCKTYVDGISLPTEPSGQFSSTDALEIASINRVISDISEILRSPVEIYPAKMDSIGTLDSKYTSKFDDISEDIIKLDSLLIEMNNILKLSESNGDTFQDGLNFSTSVSVTIANIRLSDYVTIDENGECVFNNENISDYFNKLSSTVNSEKYVPGGVYSYVSNDISDIDYCLIELLMCGCVKKDGLNVEEIQYIVNTSQVLADSNGTYSDFWNKVSGDIGIMVSELFKNNQYLMEDKSRNPEAYKKMVDLNALSDITAALCSYTSDIEKKIANKKAGEQEIKDLEKRRSQYFSTNSYWNTDDTSIFMKDMNLTKQISEIEERIKGCCTDINIEYFEPNKNDMNSGGHYSIKIGDDEIKADIYEFSEETNDTLKSAKLQNVKASALNFCDSLKYGITNEKGELKITRNDYIEKNYTYEKKAQDMVGLLKALPVVGEYIGYVYDGYELIDSFTNDEKNSVSSTETVLSDAVSISKPKSKVGKGVKKGASSAIQIVKTITGIEETKKQLGDEYDKKYDFDKRMDEQKQRIKKNNNEKNLDDIISGNTRKYRSIDKNTGTEDIKTKSDHLFSFTVYYDKKHKVDVSDNRVYNE